MLNWIESQSTPIIAILIFCASYAVAAAIFAAVSAVSRLPAGEEFKMISPVTLTPLAVILGLLIAFLAARVWENSGRAKGYIGQEAGSLSEALLFADALPPEVRSKTRTAVKQHVDYVIEHDWPEMAVNRVNARAEPLGLKNTLAALLSFSPAQANQQLAQQRAISAIEQAFEARRSRLRLSQTEIAPIQWIVILVLATLILLTTAMIHIGRPKAMAMALFIFSSAVAVCVVLLMMNDRPFAAGGVTLTPAPFREIALD